MSNLKILVVEDEVFIAEDLRDTLTEIGYEVCSVCYDSEKAASEIYRCKPDLVMLDITIKGQKDGIQLAEMINEIHHIPFIYLTSHSDKDTINRAKHTRPKGYIVKPFNDKDLITTIEIALFNHGEELRKKNLDKSFVDRSASVPLSNQEYEVFLDVVDGLNNKQISEKHKVSVNTIKTYIKRLFDKLGVNDRVGAVRKVVHEQG